ncbi:hypothetical protein EDB85DRAFT_2144597 [Lactarius pseudohatsudake]|nr:hypothetical protein EDB85DRAFT_2144597 [Lactarius pseudohatsudake]
MTNVYRRCLLFLGYIKGVYVSEWTLTILEWLNNEVRRGIPRQSDTLWNHVTVDVTVSPSPARDSPRDYTPTADIPFVESANTPEDPWWDWQAEEDPRVQERVWAAIEALEDTARTGRLPQQPRRNQPSSSRAAETDHYAQEPEIEAQTVTTAHPQQRADNWLSGIKQESDEVKDLVLQEIWGKEGFRDT